MNAVLYIILKSLKNNLKELIKKPVKLTLYLIIAALLITVIVSSFSTRTQVESPASMFWFTGILFLFITIFFITAIVKGLSSGDAIFEMNDVNLLFVSPVSSRKILLYGIVRTAKEAFWAGFFILFQINLLASFGAGYGGVLLTFASFMISAVILTIFSLVIYIITNGRKSRKRLVKFLAVVLFFPIVVYLVLQYFSTQNILVSLEMAIHSPFLSFIPIAGWTANSVTAFLSGELPRGLLFLGLNLLLGAGMTIYILLSKTDYYEDVLVATETAYEKLRAISEGNINAVAVSNRTIQVSKTGIFGEGAASLFGKHLRESFRQSRFGFLTISSVLFVIGAAAASFFIENLLTVMQVLMWLQIFLIGTGRGLKETYSHYIYMLPESSFKKILWSNMEIMAKTLIESVLIFGISGVIISANPALIILCVLAYTLFSLLLLGVNYLSMRITKANISHGILLMIYIFAVVLIMLPGIALAIITGSIIGGDTGVLAGLLVLALWELVAGLVCLALSKGVLHNCDIAVLKVYK
jgi:hypothetical protein